MRTVNFVGLLLVVLCVLLGVVAAWHIRGSGEVSPGSNDDALAASAAKLSASLVNDIGVVLAVAEGGGGKYNCDPVLGSTIPGGYR